MASNQRTLKANPRFNFHGRAVNPLDDVEEDDEGEDYVVPRRRESVMGVPFRGSDSGAFSMSSSAHFPRPGLRRTVHDSDDEDRDDEADVFGAAAAKEGQGRSGVFGPSTSVALAAIPSARFGSAQFEQASGVFEARRRSTKNALEAMVAQRPGTSTGHGEDDVAAMPEGEAGQLPPCLFCLPPHRAPALKYRSLCVFSGTNPFRVFVHNVVKHRYFEAAIIVVIAVNCGFLVAEDPTAVSPPEYQTIVDLTFATVYTAEMLAKQIAFGLVMHPHAYLRDRWNVLDFLIVILTWLGFAPGFGNYSGIRVLRVLRPLRSMNAVKGLKLLVTALLESFAALWPVLLLFTIVLAIFSVIGVQLYGGSYQYFCVSAVDNTTIHPDGYNCDTSRADDGSDFLNNFGTGCPAGYNCLAASNADNGYGYSNFDNTLYSVLMVFQVVTFEGWPLMCRTAEEVSGTLNFFFFFFLILIGSYLLPNLALAVINERYHNALEKYYRKEWKDAQDELEQRRQEELEQLRLRESAEKRSHASKVFVGEGADHVFDLSATQTFSSDVMLAQEAEEAKLKFERLQKRRGSRRSSFNVGDSMEEGNASSPIIAGMQSFLNSTLSRRRSALELGEPDSPRFNSTSRLRSDGPTAAFSPKSSARDRTTTSNLSPLQLNSLAGDGRRASISSLHTDDDGQASPESDALPVSHGRKADVVARSDSWDAPQGHDEEETPDQPKAFVTFAFPTDAVNNGGDVTSDSNAQEAEALDLPWWLTVRNMTYQLLHGCDLQLYAKAQKKVEAARKKADLIALGLYNDFTAKDETDSADAVGDDADDDGPATDQRTRTTPFAVVVMLAVVLNTAVLAAQHFQQPAWLDSLTDVSNKVFLSIFLLELVLLLIAEGKAFVKHGFYIFDAVIVALSVAELFLSGGNVIAVFRSLRLLRVLKLLHNVPALQSLVQVMLDAMQDTLYLTLVLFLLMLIFALSGMQFFGGVVRQFIESTYPGTNVRTNFDSFINAFYSVFVVITGDNWPTSMYQSMAATNPAAALYYVLLILLGTYVILNLFLSILIQGFEAEGEANISSDDDDREYKSAIVELQRQVVLGVGERQYNQVIQVDEVWKADPTLSTQLMITSVSAEFHPVAFNIDVRPATAENVFSANRQSEAAPLRRPSHDSHTSDGEDADNLIPMALEATARDQTRKTLADLLGADHVAEALPPGTTCVDGAVLGESGHCRFCGSYIQSVLTSPPFEKHLTEQERHDGVCWLAEQRVAREQNIINLITLVNQKIADDALMSAAIAEAILAEGQSRRLFKTLTVADLSSWEDVRDELREELLVARLAVGEEQLGRSLMAYVHAGTHLKHPTNGSESLFFLGPNNGLRAALTAVLDHPAFDAIMLFVITGSCVILVLDNPRSNFNSSQLSILRGADLACSIIFAMEIAARIIATGFALHPGSFLRSGWNWLDLLSLVISLAATFSAAKSVRTLRFIRPLRTIKRYRGLRLIVSTILNSLSSIVYVALLLSLNYLIFGILAVELFSGKLYNCNDANVTLRTDCIGYFNYSFTNVALDGTTNDTVVLTARSWQPLTRNFDNIGTSLLTLFQVSSSDNWSDVLYSVIDAASYDTAPIRDNQPYAGLFLVAFYIVSNIFLMNLFVGVIIVNFSAVKSKVDGLSLLSDEQREWVDTQRAMLNFRPSYMLLLPHESFGWRKQVDGFLRSPTFEYFIAACITLNVGVIAMNYSGQPADYDTAVSSLDAAFVAVYVIEMALKLITYRRRYFFVPWNQSDGVITVLSAVEVVVTLASGSFPVPIAVVRVLRFLRVMRIFRLFKQARRIRVLVETLWFSLPSIANIALLIFIVFVVFAIIGLQLFGDVKTGGRFLDEQFLNFSGFFTTLQLLVSFTTLQQWSDAMYDVMKDTPGCGADGDGSCGVPYAPVYFVIFVVICGFVMTNLFLAIILDNFEATIRMDQSSVTLADLHRFTTTWSQYDPDASLIIPTKHLSRLLAALQPPLGTTRSDSRLQLLRRMSEYRIIDHSGVVHYAEVLVPLARHCSETSDALMGYDLTWSAFPETKTLGTVWFDGKPAHVGHSLAATYVAASYRRHLARKRVETIRRQRRATNATTFTHAAEEAVASDDA